VLGRPANGIAQGVAGAALGVKILKDRSLTKLISITKPTGPKPKTKRVMFWLRKKEKCPPDLLKGQRSVYEGLHNLVILFSGEQWSNLVQFSNQWEPNRSREFKQIFRKDAELRELFLECVALQCVLLFRTALGSRHSDHADYITNGTIQEVVIHFSKSIRQDYHSVRNQITRRVEALASCKEFSAQEISDKNSVPGMHWATIRGF
jgi:hypothetical protein